MNRPTRQITELTLRRYFAGHPPDNTVFVCIGEQTQLSREIAILRNVFGWGCVDDGQIKHSDVACLLISIPDCVAADIESVLSEYMNASLVLLRVEDNRKKTPLFTMLEAHGYRIYKEIIDITYFHKPYRSIDIISTGHRLGDSDIQEPLTASSRRIRNLPENTEVDLLSIQGRDLLVPERFDVAIKSNYARLYKCNCAHAWREYAYYEHILRITGARRTIEEYDGSGKKGLDNFRTSFHQLLGELSREQIPLVPIDKHFVAFDGAHRIAAAITNQRLVNCARINSISNCRAGSTFFSGTSHGHPPCPTDILDEAAIEYCRVKGGLALALIFPTVASETNAVNCLGEVCDIVYRKDIVLTPEAGGSLLRQVYLGHSWLEQSGNDTGFLHKQRSCFPFSGMLRVVLLDRFSRHELRAVKERIRAFYGIGNHSIHISDSDEETLRVARIVFNQNSIELLKIGLGNLPGFHEKLFLYRDWLEENDLDEEMFCIDGSAVLSLLGLRECRDLDFLYQGVPETLPASPRGINCHNELECYHHHTISDIVGDPRLHCWYMGVKFCTPRLVCDMKQRRRESKDRVDVILLRSRLPSYRFVWINGLLVKVTRTWGYLRARLAPMLIRVKALLRPIVGAIRRRRS